MGDSALGHGLGNFTVIKAIYHQLLKVVLRLCGLDYSWYQNFYVNWPHAVPVVEVVTQKLRSRNRSLLFFTRYDISQFANPGDTVLDIGANIGAVSTHLISLGYVVEAYEPDSRCVAFLRRRFSKAGSGRLTVHHEAVSNYNGTVRLNYGNITTESNSILEDRTGADEAGGETVPVRSITDILDSTGYVPLIKIDIEGAEYDVLDELLRPEYVNKFGMCIVESHAGKMPALEARHSRIESEINRLDLRDRVFLDWD